MTRASKDELPEQQSSRAWKQLERRQDNLQWRHHGSPSSSASPLEQESHEDCMDLPTEPGLVPGSSLRLDLQVVYAHSAISHEYNFHQT